MATIDKYNIAKVYEQHLKASLEDAITTSIVNQMVEEFREKAEVMVREETSKICIEGVEKFSNFASNTEEMIVYCKWVDETK